MPCGEMWSKICHVETYLHMINVETNLFCHYLCCFVAKSALLPVTLYWRKIYIVAMYTLLCEEKFIQKLCMWRKKDKYEVWSRIVVRSHLFSRWSQSGLKTFSTCRCFHKISICLEDQFLSFKEGNIVSLSFAVFHHKKLHLFISW